MGGVGDICTQDVITIAPDASLGFAAHLMREKHVGMLVVVGPAADNADRMVQGVLTDRDIVLTILGHDAEPKDFKVMDVMTRNPLLVAADTSIAGALGLMRAIGVRRAPLVGTRNELVGVLSIDDVLDVVAEELTAISAALHSQRSRERALRP